MKLYLDSVAVDNILAFHALNSLSFAKQTFMYFFVHMSAFVTNKQNIM